MACNKEKSYYSSCIRAEMKFDWPMISPINQPARSVLKGVVIVIDINHVISCNKFIKWFLKFLHTIFMLRFMIFCWSYMVRLSINVDNKECILILLIALSADCHLKATCEVCVVRNFKLNHLYNHRDIKYCCFIYIS